MALSVRCIAALWPAPHQTSLLALQLGFLCLVGALVHIGVQILLWASLGQGSGPERHALEWTRSVLMSARIPVLGGNKARTAFLKS